MAQTDRHALVALYNATDGANWHFKSNWGSGALLSDWYGVTANDQGRVVKLSLAYNNLRGKIPAWIGQLGNLSFLGLHGNKLSGPIPPELVNHRIFGYFSMPLVAMDAPPPLSPKWKTNRMRSRS